MIIILIKVGLLIVANYVENGKDVEKKSGKNNSTFSLLQMFYTLMGAKIQHRWLLKAQMITITDIFNLKNIIR